MKLDLNKKEVEVLFEEFILFLRHKNISLEGESKYSIPISIFSKKLSVFESIVKYLREEERLSYKKIAELLYKKTGPVGVTYRNSIKKISGKFKVDLKNVNSEKMIPITIFNEKYTLFESVVMFLHNEMRFSFKEIAKILGRNYRTVWTIFRRAKSK